MSVTGKAFTVCGGRPLVVVAVLLALFFTVGHGVAVSEASDNNGYATSSVCKKCHIDIYNSWKKSLHSISYTNPIFKNAYSEAYLSSKGGAKYVCLKCHAPTSLATGDVDVEQAITSEGVTCDFCHTVESVDLTNSESPFKLDVGGKKRASIKDAKSPVHAASYAKWFNTSKMCAGCHEVTNMKGVKTGSTYTEWKQSEYAKNGLQCQGCHMTQVKGKVVDPSVKETASDTFHDHSLSHNVAQMGDAVDVVILNAQRTESGRLVVEVAMTNTKAGHNVPTGMPSRSLVLEVRVKGTNFTEAIQRKAYGKKLVDENGETLVRAVDVLTRGVKVLENTSLKPNEERVARFMFSSAPKSGMVVTASAYLVYTNEVSTQEQTRILMGSAKK